MPRRQSVSSVPPTAAAVEAAVKAASASVPPLIPPAPPMSVQTAMRGGLNRGIRFIWGGPAEGSAGRRGGERGDGGAASDTDGKSEDEGDKDPDESDSTSSSSSSDDSSETTEPAVGSGAPSGATTPLVDQTPVATPVISPLVLEQSGHLSRLELEPFPPPPEGESFAERTVREQEELKMALLHLHNEIWRVDSTDARVFLEPVDLVWAPGYTDIVKVCARRQLYALDVDAGSLTVYNGDEFTQTPMDLSMIGERIKEGYYKTAWPYMDDMALMIDNCLQYNKPGTFHNRYAQKLNKLWAPKVETMLLTTLVHHRYCCGRRRVLSGLAYRCRGGTCFVRYGCVYWSYDPKDGEDDVVYCQSHYQRLPSDITIPRYGNGTGGDLTFRKTDLKRSKHNTPLVQENFVTCVECGHKDHEICKMHCTWANPVYYCDRCRAQFKLPSPTLPSPRDLPQCHLSRALEAEVSSKVSMVGPRVCIRVVDMEKECFETKALLKLKYPDHAPAFPYLKKVILSFLDIEGRPVCFFGMIIHEYGAECPEPNSSRSYLSLLDSVKLPKTMLPSFYRTAIYHSIVRGYLREAGRRSFQACHIYTCPPRKGQNYIFPFKPDDQKEISVVRLRKWYADMLTASANCEPKVINGYRNIGDVYKKPALTQIPYFDGDNWPDILEDILKIDKKIKDAAAKKEELWLQVEKEAVEGGFNDGESRPNMKPRPLASGHYEGLPPPKKRRKAETKRPPKPKLTLEARLNVVMASSKRDFLVVDLINAGGAGPAEPDPDLDLKLPSTGGEHSVGSFLRSEKLEFSSLRHAKFSTMLLVHALLADKLPPERYPDKKVEPEHDAALEGAGEAAETVGAPDNIVDTPIVSDNEKRSALAKESIDNEQAPVDASASATAGATTSIDNTTAV